jgi:hypothetical protein
VDELDSAGSVSVQWRSLVNALMHLRIL